jgi:hypothetical protein
MHSKISFLIPKFYRHRGEASNLPVIPGWSEGPGPESRDSQMRKLRICGSMLRIAPE